MMHCLLHTAEMRPRPIAAPFAGDVAPAISGQALMEAAGAAGGGRRPPPSCPR